MNAEVDCAGFDDSGYVDACEVCGLVEGFWKLIRPFDSRKEWILGEKYVKRKNNRVVYKRGYHVLFIIKTRIVVGFGKN